MTKRALLILTFLVQVPFARGAANLIEQFKKNVSVVQDKVVIDSMRPEEINATVDEEGRIALFYSRHLGTTLLLLAGANPNLPDRTGRTPAFRAVSQSNDVAFPIMVDLLLLARADVNARDKEGTTLLAWAVHEKNFAAARLLLLLGADPTPNDVPGDRTPLFFASQQPDPKIADLLRSFAFGTAAGTGSSAANTAPARQLADAARAARLIEISDALAAGADLDARDKDGATALFRAVSERRASVVALLLLAGAKPNLAKTDGKTPLMQCVTGCDMDSERMLVDLIVAGADVNATAKDGTTALSQAVHCCNDTAARWMIWRGASLDVHSPDGTLMQGAALRSNWPSMIVLLKEAGLQDAVEPLAKVKDPDLLEFARTGTAADIELELQTGMRVDVTNRYDQTAFEWAVCYDRDDIVDLLLRHGADINHQHHHNGEHILHTLALSKAATGTPPAIRIEKLVKRGANPNLVMRDGCTPLMIAARTGGLDATVAYLLTVTADIDARDKDGVTALGLARQHGHSKVARLLQSYGAGE